MRLHSYILLAVSTSVLLNTCQAVEPLGLDCPSRRQTIYLGQNARLCCNLLGRGKPTEVGEEFTKILLRYKNQTAYGENYVLRAQGHPRFFFYHQLLWGGVQFWLNIKNVTLEDAGQYWCAAQFPEDDATISTIVELAVHDPAVIVSHTRRSHRVLVGEPVTLRCDAKGTPQPVVSWYKYNYMGVKQDLKHKGPELRFPNTRSNNAGTHECIANNLNGTASRTFTIEVLYKPAVRFDYKEVTQSPSGHVLLTCSVRAHPAVDEMVWSREGRTLHYDVTRLPHMIRQDQRRRVAGKALQPGHFYQFTSGMNSTMYVLEMRQAEFGLFSCSAKNLLGTGEASVRVRNWYSRVLRVTNPPVDVISRTDRDVTMQCGVVDFRMSIDQLEWWWTPASGDNRPRKIYTTNIARRADTDLLFTAKFGLLDGYNLQISGVQPGDSGVYRCQVNNDNYTASLTVLGKVVCDSLSASGGSTFTCSVKHMGPMGANIKVMWSDARANFSSLISDSDSAVSRMLHVSAENSSKYHQCTVFSSQPPYMDHCAINGPDSHDQGSTAARLACPGPRSASALTGVAIFFAVIVIVELVAMFLIARHFAAILDQLRRRTLSTLSNTPSIDPDPTGKHPIIGSGSMEDYTMQEVHAGQRPLSQASIAEEAEPH